MRIVLPLLTLACAAALAAGQGAIGVLFMNDPSPGVLVHFGGVEAGAVVMDAPESGPAFKAGLRLGDVVTAIDGKPVTGFAELSELLGALEPGMRVAVTFRRHKDKVEGYDEETVQVEVVDREVFWKAELERQRLADEESGAKEKP